MSWSGMRRRKKHALPSLGGLIVVAAMAVGGLGSCASNQRSQDLALIEAAEKGKTREVIRLLQEGANINATDHEGFTPYLAASTRGHLETMKVLKKAGAKTEAGL